MAQDNDDPGKKPTKLGREPKDTLVAINVLSDRKHYRPSNSP
ncbi:hypothetical protein [Paramagnetospirillum marisnigri]|nr:hypothetical protein [Paramagnetospirillum marisnigri]